MVDPISFAASLVTLLGVAGAASEFVYNFIIDIKDVPEEIHSQAIKLQCLHQTITILISLYGPNARVPELQLDPFLEDNLRRFLGEVQSLESRLRQCSLKLKGSRKQHVWERLNWLSSDRKLRKFYASLDTWMQIFSTAVTTTGLFDTP
jgi:hypothetical protein